MISAGAGMEKLLKYKDENVCVFNMTPSGMILSVPKVITPELREAVLALKQQNMEIL